MCICLQQAAADQGGGVKDDEDKAAAAQDSVPEGDSVAPPADSAAADAVASAPVVAEQAEEPKSDEKVSPYAQAVGSSSPMLMLAGKPDDWVCTRVSKRKDMMCAVTSVHLPD